ncbi:acyl-CoA N-acyltransferase [Aspergillus pseudocaelatus]|uniref:Acyl-CoA N-acyltransferase n=1 Tax=Aspergillus pseudocaelatus TaxID=1825620 RepID=A0ABQ6WK51_9EURO|nr:acyl-CoA N-acyltransferase [Aspergillus pseudocaelatus]
MASILTLHRVTTLEELEPLYHIGADAFRDDPCMNWFYPGGRDHPDDFVVLWKNILQMEFFDKGKFILAATIRDPDDDDERGLGRVVGFAVWERNGVCDAARSWQGGSLSKRLKRFNLNFKIAYTFHLDTPKRSISWPKLNHYVHELKLAKDSQPTESWYLSILAVSSKAQGQGVGRKLLQWGIDRSEEENIPATLVATNAGLHLYESTGFERTGWLFFDDERQKQTIMRRDVRLI